MLPAKWETFLELFAMENSCIDVCDRQVKEGEEGAARMGLLLLGFPLLKAFPKFSDIICFLSIPASSSSFPSIDM